MAPPPEPFRPQIFGKFFLLQKLGAGGMAEIYRGKAAGAVGFEKELVVKRILPALSSDRQFVRMLVNEAKLTVALTHPAIAQVYELGEVEGQHFISMELVEGASLHDLIYTAKQANKALTIEQCIFICLEVLRGLDYAHRRADGAGNPLGIVHCDVSPDNVMITWEGGIKLLDFGVARAAQGSLSNYREGTLMGKLSYAAPEQAEGEWFDHRVDLFAVGVMFYELLTGAHPFGRVQTIEALRESRKKPVSPPSQVKRELPSMLDAFVLRALAYRREDRFQSAKEMADELIDFLFPTPIIGVQEHLSATMKELYRERIERQQRLRANDPLHMKVLANARSRAIEDAHAAARAETELAPEPEQGTRIFVSALDPQSVAIQLDPGPERTVGRITASMRATPPLRLKARRETGWLKAAAAGVLGLAAGIGGTWALLASGGPTLVVLSDPAGAEVIVGERSLGITPLVLEDAPIPDEGAELTLRLALHREATIPVAGGRSVVRAEAKLSSSLGSFRIDSDPPGAELQWNGKVVGHTPFAIEEMVLDKPHRFDLRRKGYELDSFIVTPDEVGPSITRTLVREN